MEKLRRNGKVEGTDDMSMMSLFLFQPFLASLSNYVSFDFESRNKRTHISELKFFVETDTSDI